MSQNLCNELIQLSGQFAELLNQETDLMRSHQTGKALELLDQKRGLGERHQALCAQFSEKNGWKSCDASDLEHLKQALDTLKVSLEHNKIAIGVVHRVREGFVRQVTEVVKEHESPVCRYSKFGRNMDSKMPVSMKIVNSRL